MKHSIKYILIVLSLGLATSCSDWLSETDPNELGSDKFWQDLNDTNSGLTACYSTLRNHFVLNIVEETWRSDMGWPGYGRPTPTGSTDGVEYYYQTFTNSSSSISKKWDACYEGIFRANQVIEALDRLKGSVEEEEWGTQMAQARYLRGLYHFYLYTSFNEGSIIIRNKVPVSVEDFNKALSPAEDVLAFIREDLIYAYKNLPAVYDGVASISKTRATSGAAATTLGTSYLYENEIDSAIVCFDDVINNAAYGYELVDDMDLLFTTAGEYNNESIFEITYNTTDLTELGPWDEGGFSNRLANYSTSSNGFMTPAWLAYAYKTEQMDPLDERNYYDFIESEDALPVRTMRNVPLRASAMVTLVEDSQTEYYLDGNVTENMKCSATGWGFSQYKKYSNHDILEAEGDLPKGAQESGKNVVINRLAEVYLMQAECYIAKGNVDAALELMNAVRRRWALVQLGPNTGTAKYTFDEVVYSPETLMDQLMYVDKPLELSTEGHAIRWNDLRRWGIIESNFQHLSEQKFYLINYTGTTAEGKTKIRAKSSLVLSPGSETVFEEVDYEYDNTVLNYNTDSHAYFPIPLSEIQRNSNIN